MNRLTDVSQITPETILTKPIWTDTQNKKMSLEEFLETRKIILQSWPTGDHPALELDEAVKRLKVIKEDQYGAFGG